MRKSVSLVLVAVVAVIGWVGFQYRDHLLGATALPPASGPSAGARPGGSGAPSVLVVTEPVAVDSAGDQVRAIGTVAAARSVELFPEVTGIVTEVNFTSGDRVEAGQRLVLLEREEQEIAVEKARIAVADANSALDRSEQLAKSRTVSDVTVANARLAMRNAEIAERTAELALNRRIIAAPFAGIVGLGEVSKGDLVNTSTRITTLDDVSSLTVSFSVPERFAGRMAPGLAVSAAATALPGVTVKGELVEVDSRIDQKTRSLAVKARLMQATSGLKPGMAVTVTATFPPVSNLSISSAALQWDRAGSYVWKLEGEVAKRTGVDILGRRSGTVLVAGTLKAGDEVVIEGLQRLRDGTRVTRTNAGPGGGAAPGGQPRARTEG